MTHVDVMVDSRRRDPSSYPNPNKFTMVLQTPVEGVVGAEVVSLNVARTEYAVNVNNNELWISIDGGDSISVRVPPGNHTPETFVDEINASLRASPEGSRVTVVPLSSPFGVTGLVAFLCDAPFMIDLNRSSMANVLGFYGFGGDAKVYSDDAQNVSRLMANRAYVPTEVQLTSYDPASMVSDRVPPFHALSAASGVAQRFRVTGPSSELRSLSLTVSEDSRGVVDVRITEVASSRIVMFGDMSPSGRGSLSWSAPPGGGVVLRMGREYVLEVMGRSPGINAALAMGYDASAPQPTVPNTSVVALTSVPSISWTPVPMAVGSWSSSSPSDVGLVLADPPGATSHRTVVALRAFLRPLRRAIVPPGVMNLSGEPYVVLRCEEIEMGLREGVRGGSNYPGLARAVVSSVQGGVDNRSTTFGTSFLGSTASAGPGISLDKLTVSFETWSGRLYDSMGVDNSFVVRLTVLAQDPDPGPVRVVARRPERGRPSARSMRLREDEMARAFL